MDSLGDITVHLPSEYLDDLSLVIESGIQRAKISQEARKSLASWWEAEKGMLSDELSDRMKEI